MTFLRLLIGSLALAVLFGDAASGFEVDYEAKLKQVAAMDTPQRQRWLLELESRLDAATRKVSPRRQAAEQRAKVYKLLRQKIVPRDQLIALMRLADQREETARALAARPDPIEFMRQSIIRQEPQSPLPSPTPAAESPQRRGNSSAVATKVATPRANADRLSSPTIPRKPVADVVPRRGDNTLSELKTGVPVKPGRGTIDLFVETETIPEQPRATVKPSPSQVAAPTDIAKRKPGEHIKPRRTNTVEIEPATQPTFEPPTPAETSAARTAKRQPPRTTDISTTKSPMARTVLKPTIPSDISPPRVASRAAKGQPTPPMEKPSSPGKIPAITVNMGELSSRVAGTNMALRSLEAELDSKKNLTVDELDSMVGRLNRLATRRKDLALYLEVISPQQRATVARLESPRTVIMQLQSRLDTARTDAAGPYFVGSESDRQTVLWLLDKLSRTLGKL